MHARHRSPGHGYRSNSVGIGGVAANSRISPESSIRGHGMYSSEYRSYNHGFGRGQPKQFQPAQPALRRTDVFMEAGRLATEYLVAKGLLPPNVISGKWQNGSLKNQAGDFQGFRQPDGDSIPLPPEGRTSALARLGNAADAGFGRRRFADEYNPIGSRNYMRSRSRIGSFKKYGSDWGREMGRSGSWSEKARVSPDMEGDNGSFSGYQEGQQVGNGVISRSQKSHANELAPKSDGGGDSESASEKFQFQDDMATNTKAGSSNSGRDFPPETDVEVNTRSEYVELLNEETVELKDGTHSDQIEKQTDRKAVPTQQCEMEGDFTNKNGGDLLSSLCRFAKVPTRTRSSLTARAKVDPVSLTEEEKSNMGQEENNCDMGPPMGSEVPIKAVSVDSSSFDASSNQNQSSKCPDSDILKEPPVMSVEDAGESCSMHTEQGKCTRSLTIPDGSFVNEQESSAGPPGFGRCNSMIMERGEKRAAQHSDTREGMKKAREWVPSVVTQNDEYSCLSNLRVKQPSSQEGRRSSSGEEVISTTEQERLVDMSLFQRAGAGSCIEYAEEKQLFPGSFKICDLNLMEASEVNENSHPHPHPDPILLFPSVAECKKEAMPIDVDLSISNNCNISGKYGRCGADGKEVEVIDLENDSVQEDTAINNSERKAETVFTGLESFPNQAQSANDISDVQDGYGLMFSELLGTDISNCSSVPVDINSLHNEMTLHNGEGILGDDESIYMSLGEIPISMPEI